MRLTDHGKADSGGRGLTLPGQEHVGSGPQYSRRGLSSLAIGNRTGTVCGQDTDRTTETRERVASLVAQHRTVLVAIHDNVVGLTMFWSALWLGSSSQLGRLSIVDVATYSFVLIASLHILSVLLNSYATVWRHFGVSTLDRMVVRSLGVAAAVLGSVFLYDRLANISRSSAVLLPALLLAGWLVPRWFYSRYAAGTARESAAAATGGFPVLLVGGGPLGMAVADWLRRRGTRGGPYPVGFLDDDIPAGRRIGSLPVLGRVSDVRRVIATLRLRGEAPRWILVTDEARGLDERSASLLREVARRENVTLDFASVLLGPKIAPPLSDPPGGITRVEPSPWLRFRLPIERLVASLMFVCSLPAIGLAALGIAWQLGRPVLFPQARIGRGCTLFRVTKLRTMRDVVDDDGNVAPVEKRLTPVGLWVRRLRIDELLQLWNVVRGEMALIGPRPLVLEDVLDMPEQGRGRFVVRPGITGWAQVNGGNDLTPEEKYAMDLWYIAHASPALDLRIVWRTLRTVFRGERRDEEAIATALAWYRSQRAGSGAASREAAA